MTESVRPPAWKQVLETFIRAGRPTVWGWSLIGASASTGIALIVVAALIAGVNVPLPAQVPGDQAIQASQVFDAQGKVIGILRGEQNREDVSLKQISPHLINAVVATEDRFFFKHSGVSPRGIVRAFYTNLSSGEVAQGGSTITQQYARTAFKKQVGNSRTFSRKVREIDLAQKLEERYSKDAILELYLNSAYFGRRAYGAEAAAQNYFKVRAQDLSLGQAAYLAGVLRAPKRFQVETDPQAVVRIRNEVLSDMERARLVSRADAYKARTEDIVANLSYKSGNPQTAQAGYFIEHVRRLLQTPEFGFTEAQVSRGGLKIYTTLDMRMQAAAENAVRTTLNLPDDPEVALVAMDTRGNVRSMVGGRDVDDPERARGFNFATNVRSDDGGGRPPGSAFKPFALAALLENGGSINSTFPGPSKIVIGSDRCRNADGSPWTVTNFDGTAYGTLDVSSATAFSTNTVFAQIMDKLVSPDDFIRVAGNSGVPIPESDEGCALTLGTSPVTPLEMARGFTTFAARGQSPEPVLITRIESAAGKTLMEAVPRSRPAVSERTADTVNQVLEGVIEKGTGRGAKSSFAAAGKTGTSQNYADAWFAGYTPDLTAVVWMGFPPDGSGRIPEMTNVRGIRITGGSLPATIWSKFMQEALRGASLKAFPDPAGELRQSKSSGTCTVSAGPDLQASGCRTTRPRRMPSPVDGQTIPEPLPAFDPFAAPALIAEPAPPAPAPPGGLLGILN